MLVLYKLPAYVLCRATLHKNALMSPCLVQGAEEMNRMEHLLNVYAARNARGAVADFLGYCEVEHGQASGKLSEGVWLVRHRACTPQQAASTLTV